MTAVMSPAGFSLIACHNFATAKKYSTSPRNETNHMHYISVYADGIHGAVYT